MPTVNPPISCAYMQTNDASIFPAKAIAYETSYGIKAANHQAENRGLVQTASLGVGEAIPTEPARLVSGTVQEGLAAVARTVRVYRRSDGVFMGEATSDGSTGAFTVKIYDRQEEVYAIAFDDAAGVSYNAVILDKIMPA